MNVRRLPLLALLLALGAGCDAAGFAPYDFELRTDRTRYAVADAVVVTLRSEVGSTNQNPIRHALWAATLHEEVGGTWAPVRRLRPAGTGTGGTLGRGQVVTDTLGLADWAVEPGATYQFRAAVSQGAAWVHVPSNRFVVE